LESRFTPLAVEGRDMLRRAGTGLLVALTTSGVVVATGAAPVQADGVRGHWSLDETGSPPAVAADDSGNGNDGSSFPSEKQADRHIKGSNVGCLDGHVDTIPLTEWQLELARPIKNRLWCNPLTADGR